MRLKRIIISIIFIPTIIVIAKKGELYFLILAAAIIGGGIWEFYSMTERGGKASYKLIGTAGALLMPLFLYYRLDQYIHLLLTLIIITVVMVELCCGRREFFVYNIAVTLFGVFYVGWLGSHMVMIREIPAARAGLSYSDGFYFVMLLFILTWCYDTGAYTAGSIAGKHKIFPRISPGKSLEGIIGGIILALAGVLIARIYIFPFLSVPEAAVMAVLVSIAGQAGDLAESMIKRDMKRKDSSNTIPGHGGILDRFDSLLFNAPVVYYMLVFFLIE